MKISAKTRIFLVIMAVSIVFGSVLVFAEAAGAGDAAIRPAAVSATVPAPKANNDVLYLAAALAVGLSSLAAGWAVSTVGTAAFGAISERPELAGRALIFVGLAEGIAIYGLIIAIMLIGKAA